MHRGMRSLLLILVMSFMGTMMAAAAPSAQQAQYATPVAVVNTSFLNVRTGPGPQYPVLLTVVGGSTLQVMGITGDGTWLQVSTQAGLGWLDITYTLPRGNFQFVPVVKAPPVPETAPVTATYSGSSTITGPTPSTSRLWGASLISTQSVRPSAGLAGANIQDVGASDGIIYAVLDAAYVDGVAWVKLQFNPQLVGWVDQSHVRFRPYGCGYTIVRMTHDTLLSAGPDNSGTEVGISGGHEAYLIDRVGDSFKLELQSGAIGWADVSTIAIRDENAVTTPACTGSTGAGASSTGRTESGGVSSSVTSGPHVIVNTGYLNIRSGAGAQYETVATVPGGTRLAVVGRASDGVWYLVEGGFGRGWLNIEYAIYRSRGGVVPVISETAGTIASPTASFSGSITLYTAPNLTLGTVGTVQAPAGLSVIGQSSDGNWIQVSSPIGSGWVQRLLITVTGNLAAVPVIP